MITDIWIDEKRLDLYSDTNIKYTLQVNDIAEVKDRQASFTNSFNIPMTPRNVQIFQGLGIPSDTSLSPYSKPSCKVKLDGFDLIIKGWINITETNEDYKVYIYSGIIDFFKAIENKSLGNIVGTELDHEKNVENVIASFTNDNYRYLIADYNGQTHYVDAGETIINIDYLVPSARILYLWNKIHDFAQKDFDGSIFLTEAFSNLWLTYPKSIDIGQLEPAIVDSTGTINTFLIGHNGTSRSPYDKVSFNSGTGMIAQTFFRAPKKAKYSVKIKLGMAIIKAGFDNTFSWVDGIFYYSINQESMPIDQRTNTIEYYRNVLGKNWSNPSSGVLESGEINIEFIVDLNQSDELSFFTYCNTDQQFSWTAVLETKIAALIPGTGDFANTLDSMSATDFVKEIVNQFGLTPYTDEHSDIIRYRTIKERVLESPVLDWTDKYIGRTGESYVNTSYAQKNTFRYQYADQNATHNNGSILINNLNLSSEKDLFSSKTYSPERDRTTFYIGTAGSYFSEVFRIYDKEVKDNNGVVEITYKGLDKRFHFVRAETVSTSVKIGSNKYGNSETVSSLPIANFDRLDWDTLIQDYYLDLGRIINDARIHDIDLYLYPTDILMFDLFCLVYFAQEQQYYIVNKLNYSTNSDKSSGEFVRVKKELSNSLTYFIRISWEDDTVESKTGHSSSEVVKLISITPPANNPPTDYVWQVDSGSGFVDSGSGTSPKTINFPTVGTYQIRYKSNANGSIYYSNVLQYQKVAPNIYITDVVSDSVNGVTQFNLHVDNEPFDGYLNLVGNKSNARAVFIDVMCGNIYTSRLTIANNYPDGEDKYQSLNVLFPIGIYSCELTASGTQDDTNQPTDISGGVAFGFNNDYHDNIATTDVLKHYEAIN